MSKDKCLIPGAFTIGCNYLASHAGTGMWSDWRPKRVKNDFKTLSDCGVETLRVIPMWPDFQPLKLLCTYQGIPAEYRNGEDYFPDTEAGNAGVSEVMINRFSELLKMAEARRLKVIVPLINCWMSGRLFVPEAFAGKNVLIDPAAIMWQTRFVKYFVNYFKDSKVILAWELGNECNCMSAVTRAEAWNWTSAIINAVRVSDSTRPVFSGMHSLASDPKSPWTIADQGELSDVMNVHAYPPFTPHCGKDPLNTMKPLLHASAESVLYSGISGKPCMTEEIGSLGPMNGDNDVMSGMIRANLFSLFAHGDLGFLWWCNSDFSKTPGAPYDWFGVERELGLVNNSGKPKPFTAELKKFGQFKNNLPFGLLPKRLTNAVCILSEDQDQWGTAYGSFVLAKQAGFDLDFQFHNQPLKDAGLYLLPSTKGNRVIDRRKWFELLRRVKNGASLYISTGDAGFTEFEEVIGLKVKAREERLVPFKLLLDGIEEGLTLLAESPMKYILTNKNAQVLGFEEPDNPVFTSVKYGRGTVYFLSLPLEQNLITKAGAFHAPEAPCWWKIYAHISKDVVSGRVVSKSSASTGVTEHPLDKNQRVICLISYSPLPVTERISLKKGWKIKKVLYGVKTAGSADSFNIKENDAVVIIVSA